MKTSIFSQSLTALDLRQAIQVAAAAGYDAIELGCFAPHLTLEMAETRRAEVSAWLKEANLPVSALSLNVSYTSEDDALRRANIDETCRFIRLCRRFGAGVLKTMPGGPSSARATEKHWDRFRLAMDIIVPVAEAEGVRLAIETHLGHLSDSIATAARCIESGSPDVLGVNLDFCNVRTCCEDPVDAIQCFRDRIYLTHVKDSLFSVESGEYAPMGAGKMNYAPIVEQLRAIGYGGYLSVECLYAQAKGDDPGGAVAHDLRVLRELLSETGIRSS